MTIFFSFETAMFLHDFKVRVIVFANFEPAVLFPEKGG